MLTDQPNGFNNANSSMVEAILSSVNASRCNFEDADLTRVSFQNATLTDANFTGAILTGTQFINASAEWANFSGAQHNDSTRWGSIPPPQ